MELMEKALEIAMKAHDGQEDKAERPYIEHPMTVAEKMETEDEKIVALLHDVVEDSDISIGYLRKEGFSEEILSAVDSITKRKSEGEEYPEYIERLKKNPLAVRVKLADLDHNSDLSRIANPTDEDYERVEKYKGIIEELLKEF